MAGGGGPEPATGADRVAPDRVAARIAGLSAEQRALFERLRQAQRQAAGLLRPPPIPRLSGPTGEGDWPLSLDQERYWFMEELSAHQAGLNITAASRMRGAVSVPVLEAALRLIERRHAAWRTTFPVAGDGPVQRVAPPEPPAVADRAAAAAPPRRRLALIDLAALPAARREPAALAIASADGAVPFDLEHGPLVRSCLLRLGAGDHACLLTMHHLVTDWISFQIVWGEVAAIYTAVATGQAPALPEPPVQYPDFALWQRRWLQGEVLAALTSWWRERLAGVPLVLDLPTDRPRPALAPPGGRRGGRRSFRLGAALAEGLRVQARQNGATLFMSLLAGAAALLHRDTGQERLILGANNANRNRPEIEPVLGCFLTQVPFAIDLAGNPTWRELLGRCRQSALGAMAHQDLPFGRLVEAIAPRRDASRPPLVQALVQVLDGSYSRVELAGIELAPMDVHDGRARYDLMLTLTDLLDGIAGGLEFDAGLFDPATAARWTERFALQAAAAVADPELRLLDLPQLSAAARHQVCHEWNDTARPLPAWTVPGRIAGWAAAAPEAIAVAAAGAALSYGELERRSGALARRLLAAGLPGGEPRVAVALARTADVPVAILGVWKAGGAYVPLDLAAPPERLAWMLGDAEPAAVVHRGALPMALPAGCRSVDLGLPPPASAVRGAEPGGRPAGPAPPPPPGSLAYLIYTSGTTGRPKAVLIEHGGLAATLASVLAMSGLGPGDRVPNLAPYSFDASLLELFGALAAGATVEIVGGEQILDPAAQVELLARATRLFSVPSLMRRMAAAVGAAGAAGARPAALRTLFPGGEAVTAETLDELQAAFPAATAFVCYGPTETSILCLGYRVPPDRPQRGVMIGRPFPHVELRVVGRGSDAGSPVALGMPGELWVSGPGVGRGYFRRAELTAERFVERDGRRFYRTGDLVRQLAAQGGAVEFLGRVDLQVKVRGVRIEPAEVEAALLTHPAITDAVVVAQPDSAGENRLVAYWVPAAPFGPAAEAAQRPEAGPAPEAPEEAAMPRAAPMPATLPTPAALRAFLAARLPEALVPSVLVALAELPRGSSGKVERARLPPASAAAQDATGEAPASPGEEIVAAVWREILGLERVPRDANFFDLGGHSLLATQVVSRLRARTGVELRVRDLFQAPTVAGLAAAVGAALAGRPGAGIAGGQPAAPPPIRAVPRQELLPLSFAQERLWFLDRLAPGSAYHIPVALAARGDLALPVLAAAVGEMVRRHEALRTHFTEFPAGAGWQPWPEESGRAQVVQVIEPAGGWRLPLVDLAPLPPAARGAAARRLAAAFVARPFDLTAGPVLRNLALRLAPREHVLLLVVHHIAADGWSIGLVVREITTLYAAARADVAPAGLPELGIQYADFALWQRQWLSGERLASQLAYWRERLAGAPRLELPADRPRPAAPSFRGATRSHAVAPDLAAAVRALARRGDATLFMVLLAAVQALLGRHAAARDVVIGTPIANRNRAETEPLIGFFVNSLALRGDLTGDPAFGEMIARARRSALEAYAHQDLPFERVVEELRPARHLAPNPLFSVMFGVQNAPFRAVELPGVSFSPFALDFPVSRFDLEIMVSEEEPAAPDEPRPGGGLNVQVTWSAELFEPATVRRLLGHLDALLAAAAADPGLRLSALPLLAAAERHQLLAEWNDTAVPLPDGDLATLFAAVVRRRPEAIALLGEEGCVSYGELARQAAEIAWQLRQAGVGGSELDDTPDLDRAPVLASSPGLASATALARSPGMPGDAGGTGTGGPWGAAGAVPEGAAGEIRVGLLAARSPAMIAGMLGIVQAGGVYVPLDPAYPAERLALMLADSAVQVVLGQPELYPRLAAAASATPAWVDLPAGQPAAAGSDTAGATAAMAMRAADPARLAYVMYTSGSTGRPKGVGVTHRGIVRLVHGGFADLGAEQVFLQLAPISFDASTLEIWAPLLGGGRLALFPPRAASLQEIGEAVARWGVTTLWLTAGLFHQMVEENLPALAPLGQLLAGGDVLSPPHVARARAGLPRTVLVNGYGPTEATTFTCCAPLTALPAAAPAAGERIPIGRPIGNTRVHVLGPDRDLMPAGSWGELWVGGDGLARGYLGQPGFTAESFSPDPFAGLAAPAGTRLYRTGDIARRLADGRLEFGGRRDGQVKLRGIRIELGEIESVLARHPGVAAAAATVLGRRQDGLAARAAGAGAASRTAGNFGIAGIPGTFGASGTASSVGSFVDSDSRTAGSSGSSGDLDTSGTPGTSGAAGSADQRPELLVAYVVPRLDGAGAGAEGEGPALAVAPGAWESDPELAAAWRALAPELRRFLAAELPEALVPAVLVPLAALPLTANGKVNRAALPAPESAGLAVAHVPPDNPIEEAVAATTAEILGLGRAGMTDNFFGLGGHSLLATQLVSRLAQEHGLPVSLQMVFDATDLRDLAARIAEMDLPPAEGDPFAAAPEDLGNLGDAAGFPPPAGRSESEPASGPAEGGR